ncbi:hypothetical protein [Pseudomonas sp. R76]|uniref:hypothetical protein n=1 Tax=Pseudomonas sp. R76 TaxID=1573711 RepID=UPI00131FC5F1|nr:hypothetical protein [Pseudomonas sp. R76]QHD04295.1 hypothetical protein PspR76_00435 [Pseudomonas sp. R76]
MKILFRSLLKFNLSAFFVFFVFGVIVFLVEPRSPNLKFAVILVLIFAWFIFGNMKIIYKERKAIVESLKRGSIEVAASAIEFKEKAAIRAKEKMQERAEKESDSSTPSSKD